MFLIPFDCPGIKIERVLNTLDESMPGGHAVVLLDRVRIHKKDILGEAHEGFRHDASIVFKLFQPFIVRMGVATQQEVSQLYEQMQLEMEKDDFRGLMLPLTAWGEKS